MINKKQLLSLFICNLIPFTVGNGLLPLLPIYAGKLGANAVVTGYYLACTYIAITIGALSAAWVSDGLHRRKLPIILASFIMALLTWMFSYVNTIWGLALLTALIWYSGGLSLALLGILAGLSIGENERGKIFGLLALTNGLGSLVGGLGIGWLADRWSYTVMFHAIALLTLVMVIFALLLEEKAGKQPPTSNIQEKELTGLGLNFNLFFLSAIFFSIPGFFVILLRSWVMDKLGFGSLDITSTVAIGGLVSLPVPYLMGLISDRMGRKTFLYITYLCGFLSVIVLAFSRELWHFWLAFILRGLALGGTGVRNALVTDMVHQDSLGKGLAVINSSDWIGGVIGFLTTGFLYQNLGFASPFIIGGCLALAAIGMLIPIQDRKRINLQVS